MCTEQKIFIEVKGLRQRRYYVRKNLGRIRYGIYRSVVGCRSVTKLIRKWIMVVLSSPKKRPRAIYKFELAHQLLLAAWEMGNERTAKDQS